MLKNFLKFTVLIFGLGLLLIISLPNFAFAAPVNCPSTFGGLPLINSFSQLDPLNMTHCSYSARTPDGRIIGVDMNIRFLDRGEHFIPQNYCSGKIIQDNSISPIRIYSASHVASIVISPGPLEPTTMVNTAKSLLQKIEASGDAYSCSKSQPSDLPLPTEPTVTYSQDCWKLNNNNDKIQCFYEFYQQNNRDLEAIAGMTKTYYNLGNYDRSSDWLESGYDLDDNFLYNYKITVNQVRTLCDQGVNYRFCFELDDFEVDVDDILKKMDTDGDGINDYLDMCITEPENFNNFEDDDGCPEVSASAYGERIGAASAVNGVVEVQHRDGDGWEQLHSGMTIYSYDKIRTGENGKIQIMLLDQTVFTIGGDTELILDEFVYDPDTDTSKIITRLMKGVFRWVTGTIARQQPLDCAPGFSGTSGHCVMLPVGTLGGRGTDFIVNYYPSIGISQVFVNEGIVDYYPKLSNDVYTILAGTVADFDQYGITEEFPISDDDWNFIVSYIEPQNFESDTSEGGECLIATATYGSELAPQVQQLRELRDNTLLQTSSGTSFMTGFNAVYYTFAPTVSDWERENPVFKEAVKLTITPLLSTLSLLNYVDINSESEMLGYGISVILLNIGMYFVAPAVIILKIKRYYT